MNDKENLKKQLSLETSCGIVQRKLLKRYSNVFE
jgi:hypothetical protein